MQHVDGGRKFGIALNEKVIQEWRGYDVNLQKRILGRIRKCNTVDEILTPEDYSIMFTFGDVVAVVRDSEYCFAPPFHAVEEEVLQ
jgi:hypothetical protein